MDNSSKIKPVERGKRHYSDEILKLEEKGLLTDSDLNHREYDGVSTNHFYNLALPQDPPSSGNLKRNGDEFPKSKTMLKSKMTRNHQEENGNQPESKLESKNAPLHLIVIYTFINTIMCVPCMYGYASIIFNNEVFQPNINALSKLVLFSSIVHQLSFTCLSSLSFAIGQVQDAGLIFLSQMANSMANRMIADGTTDEEIVSTTIVVLGIATSLLGLVLVFIGKFRLADLVSYLPLPVVGGYLAFIGYFCLEAGVSLCISKSIVHLRDWFFLMQPHLFLLAIPGILGGLFIALASRSRVSESALPLTMVLLPIAFYGIVFFVPDFSFDAARDHGWMGKHSAAVPMGDVFAMIDLNKVQWEVAWDCFPTWVGMVFVVAFSSCLDVAAISMDMGEALDVNHELITVGSSNIISGLFGGFTGSYIFSSTIFTYRTGVHSRQMGIYLVFAEIIIFMMTVNMLEIVPLFFLGATLTFIGFDLMYEWLVEVRHKLLLSEYLILLATFISTHIVGINGGILFGIVIAVFDYVFVTAKASTLARVNKRSRAVWNHKEWELLEQFGYDEKHPKIVSFEIIGNVFFGSSLHLLNSITNGLNIVATDDDRREMADAMMSPMHRPSPHTTPEIIRSEGAKSKTGKSEFLVLDLSQMQNLDASSARGCFYQLTKMCGKRGIIICASGASPRIDWILRSHGILSKNEVEEHHMKQRMRGDYASSIALEESPKMLLFETIEEALEFCESSIIVRMTANGFPSGIRRSLSASALFSNDDEPSTLSRYSILDVFREYLGPEESDTSLFKSFEHYNNSTGGFHEELILNSGGKIFSSGEKSDAFYIVLGGAVVLHRKGNTKQVLNIQSSNGPKSGIRASNNEHNIITGAGPLTHSTRKHSFAENSDDLGEYRKYLKLGSIFGFVDFMLGKKRTFGAIARDSKTVVAKINRNVLENLNSEHPELRTLVDKLLLQASIRELASNLMEI